MASSLSDRVATPSVEVISGRCARGNGKLRAGRELRDAFYFVIQRRNPDITSLELAGPGLKQSSARLRIPVQIPIRDA